MTSGTLLQSRLAPADKKRSPVYRHCCSHCQSLLAMVSLVPSSCSSQTSNSANGHHGIAVEFINIHTCSYVLLHLRSYWHVHSTELLSNSNYEFSRSDDVKVFPFIPDMFFKQPFQATHCPELQLSTNLSRRPTVLCFTVPF